MSIESNSRPYSSGDICIRGSSQFGFVIDADEGDRAVYGYRFDSIGFLDGERPSLLDSQDIYMIGKNKPIVDGHLPTWFSKRIPGKVAELLNERKSPYLGLTLF